MGAVRIAVVSDDRLFCDGLRQILLEDLSFVVCVSGEAAACARTDLDIRVVDVRSDGALTAGATIGDDARPYVIIVNAPEDDASVADAFSMGVRGILSRGSGAADLVKAIRVVHQGGIWARRRWLIAYAQRATSPSKEFTDVRGERRLDARLSNREREVFRHAATGACNKELADRLAISEATVKAHLTRIFQKLGVTGRAELAAAYHGLRLPATPEVVRPSA